MRGAAFYDLDGTLVRTNLVHALAFFARNDRGILRSLEPKKTDVQMLHRNSPRLGEMLGEDDWFDKMSAAGRDHVRFNYMQQLQAFTEKRKQAILAGVVLSPKLEGL